MAKVKSLNLALQGGGAHGAFTWGVLDRLLADDRIHIEAISGTSAGAMNAVVVADGLMEGPVPGDKDKARTKLETFWKAVAEAARGSPFRPDPISAFFGRASLDYSPGYVFFDLISRLASPYELNPFNINPLRDLIAEAINFERVRSCDRMKLFISATNVETGRVKVFERTKLDADRIMASACLPFLYQAVEIDGVPYWDGGYMGNPALFPFFNSCSTDDILIVQINPIERKGTPRNARDILNRLNEITFNASLQREFRAIDFVSRLIEEGRLDREDYKHVLVHLIHGGEALATLGASSKMNADWDFLQELKAIGAAATEAWLERHFDDLGVRSSVDLAALFRSPEERDTDTPPAE